MAFGSVLIPLGALCPGFSNEVTVVKSYSFTSRGLGSGIFYMAGDYTSPSTDANLTEGSPTITLGTANVSYASHAFLVSGGPGAAAGGVGPVEIEVSGTSITDLGIRTPNDTEILVADITTLSLNQFLETSKKWLGQIVYTVQNAGGSTQTTFSVDFNFGFNKYEDFGNQDFTLTNIEFVGLGGANDTNFNIRVLKQDANNWIYASTGFVPGGTELLNMNAIHGAESNTSNNTVFHFKRSDLSFPVIGSGSEGLVIELSLGANTIQIMDAHIGVSVLQPMGSGLSLENANYGKLPQNNLNEVVKTSLTWDVPTWSLLSGHTQVNPTQFTLSKGYYFVSMMLEVFSPTSTKLQVKITYEAGGIVQDDTFYSGLTVATDFATTTFAGIIRVPVDGLLFEIHGERSGAAGQVNMVDGDLSIVRLSNFI